jgi:hypothetical protein
MIGDDASGDLVAVAQALTASMDGLAQQVGVLNAQVDAQESYGRRNRRMIWGLVVSLLLDAILTVVIVTVKVQANRASDQTAQVRTQQITTCVSTNEARALNVQLWEYVLTIPPSQQLTEEQKKRISDFRVFLRRTFAPRDCSKI